MDTKPTHPPFERDETTHQNTPLFCAVSPFSLPPLPLPYPPSQTPKYPDNLADINEVELALLYTQMTSLVAHTGYALSTLEARLRAVSDEADKETTLRFVASESSSTTERKERAKASRKVVSLNSERSLYEQDAIVVRALLDGYKTMLFSIKHEMERRRYESY